MKNAPMFERRHYEAIADVLRQTQWNSFQRDAEGFESLVEDFAIKFAGDNPRFDRARFLIACGVES